MQSNKSSKTASAKNSEQKTPLNMRVEGIGVSAGIVIGKALLVGTPRLDAVEEIELTDAEAREEVDRFYIALKKSEEQLEELRQRVAAVVGERDAKIFDAHLMMVADQSLIEEVINGIRQHHRNAEYVYHQAIQRYQKALAAVNDSYIRDRITDIRDVATRVINNLREGEHINLAKLPQPRIIIAKDLTPTDTASLDMKNVLGFVNRTGSRTSHTAIIARNLNIPAIVGVTDIFELIHDGETVILDGLCGELVIRPDEETIEEYKSKLAAQDEWFELLKSQSLQPAETTDAFRVQLAANIEMPSEVAEIRKTYGCGIGLFRTEYLFLNREHPPSEEEQFQAYRDVAEKIYPQSVIFRTLDLGGDKFITEHAVPSEFNPFLGKRAIRLCLSNPSIFKSQLRAILRASAYGKVRILFPMIATLEEILEAREYLEEAKTELLEAKTPFNPDLDVGIMVEVSSTALMADRFATHVDFFSIGTNDLVQYSLAADRANPEIAYLYQPSHPSIIRLLNHVTQAAYQHCKWVSICGEMAGEPPFVPLILGLGIHELSMSPFSLNVSKKIIRSICVHDAENLVRTVMSCSTADEVRRLCDDFLNEHVPDLMPQY